MTELILIESDEEVTDQSDAKFWEWMLGDDEDVLTFLEEADLARQRLEQEGEEVR